MKNKKMINTRIKCLDYALLGILGTMMATPLSAEAGKPQTDVKIRSMGEAESLSDEPTDLQKNRRVDIVQSPEVLSIAPTITKMSIPSGGLIWATEDPQLTAPELTISANTIAAFENGRISDTVRFYVRSNYSAFMKRMEVVFFHESDTDFTESLASIDVPLDNLTAIEWNGDLKAGNNLRQGDNLVYIVRAYDANGNFDETNPQRIKLVRPEDIEKQRQATISSAGSEGLGLTAAQLQDKQLLDQSFSGNGLRQQNIPIYGSRIRIRGEDLPDRAQLTINGQNYPIDLQRKFVAEYLLPVGMFKFDVKLRSESGDESNQVLNVPVTGRYLFMVGMADITFSDNSTNGVVPIGASDKYDGFISEGRLAFYLKGKVQGKYLITAQADTREQELSRMFNGFLESDPRDVFRRLDPDQYYPVYGDDSTSYRDIDSQGRLYVRVDWDKNQMLWGNFYTGITGTEYGQYSRGLYGAALSWRGTKTTRIGDPKSEIRGFAAQAESVAGHSEFLGTGGSLYYLKHTDVLRGSAQVILEVRDLTTGQVQAKVSLVNGVDYEMDEFQGRLILSKPLSQIAQENLPSITRDQPLDGFENRLLVDYEYVPTGFSSDESSVGFRGRQWFGEHVALGGTYVDENRAGDDYRLQGVDLTLQAGRGTYLKLEQASSEATSAPVFYSDNGGLSFSQINPINALNREGDAKSVVARINFKELGLTKQEWTAGAWWRDVDDGFSISRMDAGLGTEEKGVEFTGRFNQQWSLSGRYSDASRGLNSVEQTQLQAQWHPNDDVEVTAELRRVKNTIANISNSGTLAALRYGQRVNQHLELYGIAQLTLDDDSGNYADNNAITAGAKYNFANLSSVGAEYTTGDRGDSARINAEYRVSAEHSFYGNYTYSTDTTTNNALYRSQSPQGFTFGQRWRVSNQVNVFNESQFLKTQSTSGIAHSFGLDFYPGQGWTTGFTLQYGELEGLLGTVERNAYSVTGGFTNQDVNWNSRLEYRRDTGVEQRRQWVGTNRLLYKVNEDLRIAAKLNFGDTEDDFSSVQDAKFVEANLGFAYRPASDDRLNVLGRYTYLYDLSSFGQENLSNFDQRSHVFALEGIYRINTNWEMAAKIAHRSGEARMTRNAGPWFDSTADLWALQARYDTVYKWDALLEYRNLTTNYDGGSRAGWLIGVDRHLNNNLRLGIGYNFTSFSDDLTQLDFDHKGWFLNIVGTY